MKKRTIDLGAAVDRAFGDDKPRADFFIEQLNASHETLVSRIGRSTLSLLLLAVFFEILTSATGSGSITLGGLELGDDALVARLLPPAFAFIFYEAQASSRKLSSLESLRSALMIRHHFREYKEGFDDISLPNLPLYYSLQSQRLEPMERSDRFHYRVQQVMTVPFLLLPIAFLVYAYVRLIESYGTQDVWLLLGLLIALPLTVSAYLLSLFEGKTSIMLGSHPGGVSEKD